MNSQQSVLEILNSDFFYVLLYVIVRSQIIKIMKFSGRAAPAFIIYFEWFNIDIVLLLFFIFLIEAHHLSCLMLSFSSPDNLHMIITKH